MMQVVVTGVGMVTPIGNNVAENLENLRAGRHGIGRAVFFESAYADTLPFGEVKLSPDDLEAALPDQDLTGYTRTCMLATLAFREAVADAGLTGKELSGLDTGVISASTVGGMCLTDQLYREASVLDTASEFVDAYSAAAHTLQLVRRFGIRGFSDTINTACSSSANAILMGVRLIRAGRLKRVIVGGVDSLAKYTVNGFNALKILSDAPCRPFDANRTGLNLGEAAAYLVLEPEDLAAGKKHYGSVQGYGNSNDAYHASALSDQATGVVLAMRGALQTAGIQPGQVAYINTHGTGTVNNDQTELYGITRVFEKVPAFSSTKGYTGHTLGAAGALEAIYSLMSLRHAEIYPNLHFQTPIPALGHRPVVSYQKVDSIEYILSNSFGFGGNCTSLIFGPPQP